MGLNIYSTSSQSKVLYNGPKKNMNETLRVFEMLLSHFEAEKEKKGLCWSPLKGQGKAELLRSQLKLPLPTASCSEETSLLRHLPGTLSKLHVVLQGSTAAH